MLPVSMIAGGAYIVCYFILLNLLFELYTVQFLIIYYLISSHLHLLCCTSTNIITMISPSSLHKQMEILL